MSIGQRTLQTWWQKEYKFLEDGKFVNCNVFFKKKLRKEMCRGYIWKELGGLKVNVTKIISKN